MCAVERWIASFSRLCVMFRACLYLLRAMWTLQCCYELALVSLQPSCGSLLAQNELNRRQSPIASCDVLVLVRPVIGAESRLATTLKKVVCVFVVQHSAINQRSRGGLKLYISSWLLLYVRHLSCVVYR